MLKTPKTARRRSALPVDADFESILASSETYAAQPVGRDEESLGQTPPRSADRIGSPYASTAGNANDSSPGPYAAVERLKPTGDPALDTKRRSMYRGAGTATSPDLATLVRNAKLRAAAQSSASSSPALDSPALSDTGRSKSTERSSSTLDGAREGSISSHARANSKDSLQSPQYIPKRASSIASPASPALQSTENLSATATSHRNSFIESPRTLFTDNASSTSRSREQSASSTDAYPSSLASTSVAGLSPPVTISSGDGLRPNRRHTTSYGSGDDSTPSRDSYVVVEQPGYSPSQDSSPTKPPASRRTVSDPYVAPPPKPATRSTGYQSNQAIGYQKVDESQQKVPSFLAVLSVC